MLTKNKNKEFNNYINIINKFEKVDEGMFGGSSVCKVKTQWHWLRKKKKEKRTGQIMRLK